LATGVIAALAVAAPVTEASADASVTFPLPPLASIPAFIGPLLSSLGPSSHVAVAQGGAAIGDVFNGGTLVVVSTGPATGSTNGSP
jgi:hypothetical protein